MAPSPYAKLGFNTMTTTSTLVDRVLDLLSGIGVLRQRKMFGGTYIYCDDMFIATVHDDILYFKANKNTRHEFTERGLRPFTYPKQGEVATLQYYEVPAEVFTSKDVMKHWATKALTAARQDASSKSKRKVRTN